MRRLTSHAGRMTGLPSGGYPQPVQSITPSDFLNAIDDVATPEGLITIFTTNCLEDLDPAITRPGRVDRTVRLGLANSSQIQAIVEIARVVAHTLGMWPNGRMSDNHWSIYLILRNGGGSVRMNMKADFGNPKGTLEWSPNLKYTESNSEVKHWDYSTKSGVTVAHVYKLIMEKRRDQYRMAGGGSGCRWWIYTIIQDFDEKGYLTSKLVKKDLLGILEHQYSTTGHVNKLTMVEGIFTAASSSAGVSSSAGASSSSAGAFSSSAGASSSSTGASSSSTGASSAASQRAFKPPTRGQVKSYTANGQSCYHWISGNVQGQSFANEWTAVKDQLGNNLIIHRGKNLVSKPP